MIEHCAKNDKTHWSRKKGKRKEIIIKCYQDSLITLSAYFYYIDMVLNYEKKKGKIENHISYHILRIVQLYNFLIISYCLFNFL